ncbi:phage tail protein I [Roseateles sp. SL47]|uniref:phage tail protein I n=1 Tax=Roseateles sp. SL47 TaxID=2995138 RepID=UPI0022711A94|nr:phage tail protein I [Roseateles sp. SL47]WAC70801.1 phage tail protein I [Roseateles sp. SL47]
MSTASGNLLPPSASALERAAAVVLAPQVDPGVLRTLADSARIPASVLPWLAWACSTEGWQGAFTEASRRALVRSSVEIHQRKGTAGAIRRVLAAIDATVDLREWQATGGAPYTFTLTVWTGSSGSDASTALIDLELYDRIRRMVNAVKNERSHYELQVGASFGQDLRLACAVRAASLARPSLDARAVQPTPATQPLRLGTAARIASILRMSMDSA